MNMADYSFYGTAQLSKLEEARDKRDWFTAIVISATQLEHHGYLEIREHLESLHVEPGLIDALLGGMYLRDIAACLLAMGKIDKKDYKSIMKINEERRYFLHREKKVKYKLGDEAVERYRPLVNEAINILVGSLNAIRVYES